MKLITKVVVDHFRSIRHQEIGDFSNFTSLAGLNNSGKSNLLRAVNAFFSGHTDICDPLDFQRDYFCHDARSKKAKRISITIKFDLPDNFKFPKRVKDAEDLLSRSFAIRKVWDRDSRVPQYYLNDSEDELDQTRRSGVDKFLSLIAFRYIPNRVIPVDVIRNERKALRDVLIRRMGPKAREQHGAFETIRATSVNLITDLQDLVQGACPDVGSIRLATPASWQDLVFAFGYKFMVRESEIDDVAQGSGIQSLLMFETLSLIDRDFRQRFGWRQASIWAIEEPESSLHSSLEASISEYLRNLSTKESNRLQILCTTHSDLILQYSDRVVFAEMEDGRTLFRSMGDKASILQEAAKLGISRWAHPILRDPLNPVILVEGKYDCAFLEQALRLLAPQRTINVSYVGRLQGGDATGGDKHLQSYVKNNASAIKSRPHSAPVIALLDWDAARRVNEFKKGFESSDPYQVKAWPENACNPELDRSFHGIERHMPDRIIDLADQTANIIFKRGRAKAIPKDADYGKFKEAVFGIVQRGIKAEDLVHVEPFLRRLLDSLDLRGGTASCLPEDDDR
ncbi:AAA family ATPase [bacterium]|nr:AAA family ATPase [bacterium]